MTATEHIAPSGPRGDAATLVDLASERDFLLRSLADLETEHAAGDLDDDRYRRLHDHYTVQAATVLRAIARLQEDAHPANDAMTVSGRRGRSRVVVAGMVIIVVAAIGGAMLVRSLGDRQPGQTITGNSQSSVPGLDDLARAARQRPDDFDAQMAYATALMQAGNALDALRAFDAAARLDPAAPAPKAYGGWILHLAGLTNEALPRLDAAIAADPSYPDAHFFRGMVLLRGRNDPAGALAELRRFLELAPAGPERTQVQQLVDQLAAPSTTP